MNHYYQSKVAQQSEWADVLDKGPEACLIPLPTLESPCPPVRQNIASSHASPSGNINEFWEAYISSLLSWFCASLPVYQG